MSARNMAKRTAAGTLALAVCLGGGALALAGAANADTNFQFSSRIQGADRYGTAIAASQAAFKDGSAQNVVIVNGYATVDGLTASYLAGVANAPILYVDQNGASDATKAELKRLGAKNIWLVGGTTVIPQSVQDAMTGAGYSVNRINGSDRYETAKLIAAAGAKISGKQPSKVFVASGDSFADALAVSPIAYAKGYAIALTQKDSTSQFTKDELGVINTQTKILVGGTAVVSDSVAQNLTVSQRIAGADRGVTANLVADYANSTEGFNASQAALVGGTDGNGADSLVGASVLGKTMTALHFAGWDSTTQWFKDHSAALTGAGVIFGGKAAVSDSQVSTVQGAAQSVAAAAGFIVTAVPTAGSTVFSYADPASQAAKKVTFKSTDKFMVSGSAATQGAFAASLAVGATVSIVANADGTNTFSLTPPPTGGYMTGLVGTYSISSHTLTITEPITGTPLNAGYDYTSGTPYIQYTVDGSPVSQGIFEGALSLGDNVAISGTGADLQHIRTVALTSGSLMGTITAPTFSTTAGSTGVLTGFSVKTAAGAVLGPILVSGFGSSDTFSIDGTASTSAALVGSGNAGASTASPVSVGDQVTYAKTGGVQKFALVNAAPSKLAGVVADRVTTTVAGSPVTTQLSAGTALTYWSPAGTPSLVTYSSSIRYVIDGTVGSQADFVAAATPGDSVVYQPADTTTNTTASLTLTSKPVAGVIVNAVSSANSGAHTVGVLDADGDQIATGLDYSLANSVYSTGTGTPVYTVDGSAATYAQFDAVIGRIQAGARLGTLQVSVANGVTTYALATTAFTAAPAILSASEATAAGTTTVTVKFNKPIAGTLAAGDFTVKVGSGSASNVTGTVSGSTVTFTLASGATAVGTTNTVTLTTAGAAKLLDTLGTAAVASSVTYTM